MKKKILLINFGKQYGGVERYIINILNNINLLKYDLCICVRKNSFMYYEIKKINNDNITLIDLDINKINFIKTINYLYNYIKNNSIDIVHSNGITSSIIGLAASITSKSIKRITTVHGFSDFDRMDRNKLIKQLFNKMENIVFKYNDLYIAVSYGIKEYLTNKGLSEDKIKVIYHGIYNTSISDRLYTNKINNNIIKIGSVGRLETVKGYDCLIKSINNVIKEGYEVKCTILGDGSERNKLEKLANDLKIRDNIEFMGYKDKVSKYIDEMDIYIQPSKQEAFGISILEAMDRKKIIIASDIGGIPEIIKDGKNGILFKTNDSNDLAKKIKKVLNDLESYKFMAEEAKKDIEEKFNITISIKKLEEIYDNI